MSHAFSGLWVGGEVQRPYESRRGHLYLQLVEKGHGDQIVATLPAVVYRRELWRVRRVLDDLGVELSEGQSLRCYGRLDFYPPTGNLQFIVRDVDPLFALGDLERRRQETLERLRKLGLLDRNSERSLDPLPLRLGLVTSAGSAAYQDFVTTLEGSGFAFAPTVADVSVQGKSAEREIARALARLSGQADELDVVVLVRGGGGKSDLAAFDSRLVAEAIANCELPVLTGLGHETDETIADRVAHTRFKTPTGVAEFLVKRVADAERSLLEISRQLAQLARSRRTAAGTRLDLASARLVSAAGRLHHRAQRIERLSRTLAAAASKRPALTRAATEHAERRLAHAPGSLLTKANDRLGRLTERLPERCRARLRAATERLASLDRLQRQLGPEQVLRRGFSITRSAGKVVVSASQIAVGAELQTQLLTGTVASRATVVSETEEDSGG